MHKNLNYSRDKIISDFVSSPRDEKQAIVKAYDDIFKTNEWCSEFNYMLDVYNALLTNHLEDKPSTEAWKDLFWKNSIAKEMKAKELKALLWKTGANGKSGVNGNKPNDSEVEFILIKIKEVESSIIQDNYISEKNFMQWVELQRNRRYTDLIYL